MLCLQRPPSLYLHTYAASLYPPHTLLLYPFPPLSLPYSPSTIRRTQPRPPPAKSKYISSGTNQESRGSGVRIPFHTPEERQSGPPPAPPLLTRPCPSLTKHTVDRVAPRSYSLPFRTSTTHKARCG
ncbi:hypothetical protein E2C01_062953 [Portunus trituberculatus]|uniref:Uncharacterized protein n=1 Tax=Portunus trituberculatus TaxID=210409 RepID=A0A5B7HFG5_PORTR|nr:hypothetical protein [Portunus trituberculatus]